MRQLLGPIFFMLSSGLFYSDRGKMNIVNIGTAGTLAVVATLFTVEQLVERVAAHWNGTQDGVAEITAALITVFGSILAAVIGGVVGTRMNRSPTHISVTAEAAKMAREVGHDVDISQAKKSSVADATLKTLPRCTDHTYGESYWLWETERKDIERRRERKQALKLLVGVSCVLVSIYWYFAPLSYSVGDWWQLVAIVFVDWLFAEKSG